MMKKLLYLFVLSILLINQLNAHVGEHQIGKSELFYINDHPVEGYFLMSRNEQVFIELKNGKVISAPLKDFSLDNREKLGGKIAFLKQLNQEKISAKNEQLFDSQIYIFLLVLCSLGIVIFKYKLSHRLLYLLGSSVLVFYACKSNQIINPNSTSTTTTTPTKTDPAFIESTFTPFKSILKTRYDDTYFYVEAEGMPTHNMMIGITSWQQQVPIPQGYTGTNAWSIPLKPEISSSPISLKTNLMKGAVAIAPNGVPIFNPLNNRGEDAYAIGELDKWGGHCGRADDYHYHIAPLHFESTAGNNPIAMALDGYAIYGTKEPDGTAMQTLDEYHGHSFKNSYHYHATTTYPYFIGSMRGKVSLDPTTTAPENQISPQAKTTPIRPAGDPLKGATITDFKATGTNAYSLEYTLNNLKGYVNYGWDNLGNYTYTLIGTDGKATTLKYVKK